MDWVSFDEIKKTVSLQMAIDHYGIPLRRVDPNTLRGQVPAADPRIEEEQREFHRDAHKGVGGAWACQSQSCIKSRGRVGGNVLDFVAAMEQCSVRDAAIKLQTWFLVPAAGNVPHRLARNLTRKFPRARNRSRNGSRKKTMERGRVESNKPLTFTLQNIDHAHPYLNERGVTEEIAKTFGVGVFPGKGTMQDRIVIPIHNREGRTRRVCRSIDRRIGTALQISGGVPQVARTL